MFEMKCKSCGGALQVSDNDFVQLGEIVIQTCNTFRCSYCGSIFQRSEQFNLAVNMQIAHANVVINTGGGLYLAGNLTLADGADFVGRDKNVTTVIVQKS